MSDRSGGAVGGADDAVALALAEAVLEGGRGLAREPRRLHGMVNDVLGAESRTRRAEVDAVILAAEESVPEDLLSGRIDAAEALRRLRDRGLDDEVASFSLEVWRYALGLLGAGAEPPSLRSSSATLPQPPVTAPVPPSATDRVFSDMYAGPTVLPADAPMVGGPPTSRSAAGIDGPVTGRSRPWWIVGVAAALLLVIASVIVVANRGDDGADVAATGARSDASTPAPTRRAPSDFRSVIPVSPSSPTDPPVVTDDPGNVAAGARVGAVADSPLSFDAIGIRLGLERAAEALGIDWALSHTEYTDTGAFVRQAADAGNGLVVGSLAFDDELSAVAADHPSTMFAFFHALIAGDNVASLWFEDEPGQFLAGAVAAMKSKTGIVAFVGDNLLGDGPEQRFVAGAVHVDPAIEVHSTIIDAFGTTDFEQRDDDVRASTQAMFAEGADVVYSSHYNYVVAEVAAGLGAPGERWVIGEGFDLFHSAPELGPYVLTSIVWNYDVVTFLVVKAFLEGGLSAGDHYFGLSSGAIGYSRSGGFVDDIASELDALVAQIVAGDVVVPGDT